MGSTEPPVLFWSVSLATLAFAILEALNLPFGSNYRCLILDSRGYGCSLSGE